MEVQRIPKSRVSNKDGLFALFPLFVLLILCLLFSFIRKGQETPICSLLIVTIVIAIILTKSPKSFDKRVRILSSGVLNPDYMSMIWIFVLAGVFSYTSNDIGSVDVLSDLTLTVFPGRFLLCGIFITSCLLSLVSGTSLGTVVTLMPVVTSMSLSTGIDMAIAAAAVTSGSFFGDNLSVISDTTIAAVQTLDCSSRQKFLYNLRISAPAVLITLIIYYIICPSVPTTISPIVSTKLLLIIPYSIVLFLSITSLNVIIVLFLGICLNLVIGLSTGAISIGGFLVSSSSGAGSMGELVIITFLCFGLLAIIKHNGGFQFIVQLMDALKSKKWNEFSAALLVSLINLCTINNTVAILSIGPVVKEIANQQNIKRYRMASIIDVFACVTQGLLPFSAQVLYASRVSGQPIMRIIFNSYFLFILVLAASNSIVSSQLFVKESSHGIK